MVENKQEIFMNGICIYGASSQNIAAEYKKAALLGDVIIPRVSCADGVYTVALCDGEGAPYALVWLRTGGA